MDSVVPFAVHAGTPLRRLSHWPLPCEDPYLRPWSRTTSPLSRSSPFPPVVGWLLDVHRRCDLHLKVVAELPQLLRRSRVLEETTIDLEGIQFTGPVTIDSLPDASNKRSQLCAVIVRNHRTRSPSLQLAGHGNEATHYRPDEGHLPGRHPLERVDSGPGPLRRLVALWVLAVSSGDRTFAPCRVRQAELTRFAERGRQVACSPWAAVCLGGFTWLIGPSRSLWVRSFAVPLHDAAGGFDDRLTVQVGGGDGVVADVGVEEGPDR